MAKLVLDDLANLENEASAVGTINANNAKVETALENTLSRDGTSPNSMDAVIDMNSNKIVNLATPTNAADAATKDYVDSVAAGGLQGANGTDGEDGWSPILAVVSDGSRRVLQVVDWTGGTGAKPATGNYVGPSGLVVSIGSAVDIRGAQGTSGGGTGDLLAANNLSDVSNVATARTNLGLAIGTNVQAYDAALLSIATLGTTADRYLYTTGVDTFVEGTITAAGRNILDDADNSAQRTTLGLTAVATYSKATDANVRAAASNGVVTSDLIESASAPVLLSDGANIAVDWDTGINFTVTLAGNRTLDNPTNGQAGTWRTLKVTQDGVGGRTLTFGNQYKFPGGSNPTLSTAAASIDFFTVYCSSSTEFFVFAGLGMAV
jgi:hypothetical protein